MTNLKARHHLCHIIGIKELQSKRGISINNRQCPVPTFWGRGITNSNVSPPHRKPDLAELSWEDISTPHGYTQNPANSGCVYCRDTADGSHNRPTARKPGVLSSGPSKPKVFAFVSVPSPYGIRTCLWPLRGRLARFWDSRQEDTDLREGGTLGYVHTSMCVEKRPRTFLCFSSRDLTEDLNSTWATLSPASPQTIYSNLSIYKEARGLQMPLHHTLRDLSTCLP